MPFAKKSISAYEAMYEAQKIAFAPVIFQVVRTLRELGILRLLEQSGKVGITAKAISESLKISMYGVETLLESGLSCNVVEYNQDAPETYNKRVYFLSKIGYYILNDSMTRINMDFNHDVCYQGLGDLDKSIAEGQPSGLKVFGEQWATIYEVLPHLPEKAKNSWLAFDHFYSDSSYPLVLSTILRGHPDTIADIGTNTGNFAIFMAQNDPDIKITLIDLPDQLKIAVQNIATAGFSDRINAEAINLLDTDLKLPHGLDIYWMSQLLSCFGHDEIVNILNHVGDAMVGKSRLFIMETCWDRQQHEAAAYSLVNTSPYFTCMANGNSKMYHSEELLDCVAESGLEVVNIEDNLSICHSLFECRLHSE